MSIQAQYMQAKSFAAAGKLSQAEVALQQILQIDPDYLPALDLMGFVQYFLKRPDVAQTFCERALAQHPNHTYALKGLGLCLAAQGFIDEGVAQLAKAVALAPTYFDARWDLAMVLMRAERNDDAKAIVTAAMAAIPEQQHRFMKLLAKL
ncbi:MAG: tetratricopeptide repeat protein [Deltaproteobacteria bacterium]|nr:tetratricopeptide repeat protein [Deltaproteobacteria bacterium]MBN2674634.1 tetratricopeptide repeat protein [Deltaproteobacteria bacterium]